MSEKLLEALQNLILITAECLAQQDRLKLEVESLTHAFVTQDPYLRLLLETRRAALGRISGTTSRPIFAAIQDLLTEAKTDQHAKALEVSV